MKLWHFSWIALVFLCGEVFAQTACPVGVPPGDPRCGPSPEWHQPQPQQAAPPPRRAITREWVWEDRWGAIVRDRQGRLGTSENQKGEHSARVTAIEACRAHGGDLWGCRHVEIVYRNQCAAFALGGGLGISGRNVDLEEAEAGVIAACNAQNSERAQCQLVYSGCSRAEQVVRYY